ncbi:MAG: Adenylate kinase [Wolbachia endosymbiont of Ctenocephalides orientis wCori]|nr:MAG: Adenylate kinase [Wolbachia endosymbiont of Ctenocephalides orientis wCori]
MIITIFGLPGSGKGTQSSLLVMKYNLGLISVGDLLRNIISSDTELGKRIKDIVESGNLIQDKIICEILRNEIESKGGDFLLDGFPRNLNQAHFLTQILQKKYGKDIDIAIELKIDDVAAMNRLQNRIICSDCKSVYSISSFKGSDSVICIKCKGKNLEKRVDDANVAAINKRIGEYHLQMKDLREYYRDKLLTIDANLSVEEVVKEIKGKISYNLV